MYFTAFLALLITLVGSDCALHQVKYAGLKWLTTVLILIFNRLHTHKSRRSESHLNRCKKKNTCHI